MRPWLPVAAALLLLSAACSPFGGTATASPTPSPAAIPSPSPSPTPSPTPTPSPSPSPTPKATSLFVQIVSADWGDITAQTEVGASCNARVLVNGKDVPGVSNPKVADAAGTANWMYPTPPTQTGQTGQAIVTCSHNGLSGTSSNFFPVGT